MEISLNQKGIQDWEGSVLAIGLMEGELDRVIKSFINENHEQELFQILKKRNFSTKKGEIKTFHLINSDDLKKIILIGLGKPEEMQLDDIRNAAAKVARASKSKQK